MTTIVSSFINETTTTSNAYSSTPIIVSTVVTLTNTLSNSTIVTFVNNTKTGPVITGSNNITVSNIYQFNISKLTSVEPVQVF
jgi:hypothetical protein